MPVTGTTLTFLFASFSCLSLSIWFLALAQVSLNDYPAAYDMLAVIQHHRLARRDGADFFMQAY